MSDKESKFTKEYILRAFNAAVFLDEPACTEMREALNEMMGLKARIATLEAQLKHAEDKTLSVYERMRNTINRRNERIATLEAQLRWIPVSEKRPPEDSDDIVMRKLIERLAQYQPREVSNE
jgi:hypothetical protein